MWILYITYIGVVIVVVVVFVRHLFFHRCLWAMDFILVWPFPLNDATCYTCKPITLEVTTRVPSPSIPHHTLTTSTTSIPNSTCTDHSMSHTDDDNIHRCMRS